MHEGKLFVFLFHMFMKSLKCVSQATHYSHVQEYISPTLHYSYSMQSRSIIISQEILDGLLYQATIFRCNSVHGNCASNDVVLNGPKRRYQLS